MMMRSGLVPPSLVALVRGGGAGIAATLAMSAVLAGARKAGVLGEPPPRKLTRRMLDAVGVRARGRALGVAALGSHLAYGAGMGALFSLLPRRLSSSRPMGVGALFGLAVWAVSYLGWVPKLGLMQPPSRDRPGRPTAMILAHLVYGTTLGALRSRMERETAPMPKHGRRLVT